MASPPENIFYLSLLWGYFFWLYNPRLTVHSLHFILPLRSYLIRLFSLATLKILSLSLMCFTYTWYSLFKIIWDLLDFLHLWIGIFHHSYKIFIRVSTNIASALFSPFRILYLSLSHDLVFIKLSFIISMSSYSIFWILDDFFRFMFEFTNFLLIPITFLISQTSFCYSFQTGHF